MASKWYEGPDEGWKRAIAGGVSGALGFLVARATVGGEWPALALATGAATLVLLLAFNAVVFRD